MNVFDGRTRFVVALLALYGVILVVRLFSVQVLRGSHYSKQVKQQSEQRMTIRPKRGMILDRDGRILARSVPRKSAVAIEGDSQYVHINRIYPYGSTASQILGYTGQDGNGLAGIEYRFDEKLAGDPGWTVRHRDGRSRTFGKIGYTGKQVDNGANVDLTIDVEIQQIVETVLEETVKKNHAKSAMAVVMDPHSGEVYAMASYPDYNPNYWWKFPAASRKNLPVSFNYEPGSTFKVMTLASAMNESLYKASDSINGKQGRYEIYNEVISDQTPRGMITIADALNYSSNVCFAQIADSLGRERLYRYIRDFGFGSFSGIGLPGEEKGILHPLDKWSGRSAVTISFGHEISATLLQMVSAFSVVANGGLLVTPQIIRSNSDGEVAPKEVVRSLLEPHVAAELRRMMRGVITDGTARSIHSDLVELAGKTGSSNKINDSTGRYDRDKIWASFIGFTPVEKPVLVCGVVVDEPKNAAGGGLAAAPAVAEIMERIIVAPDLAIGALIRRSVEKDDDAHIEQEKTLYPAVCNRTRREAAQICGADGVAYEFVGDGEIVIHQSPQSGIEIIDASPLLLYTDHVITAESEDAISVPNCVGRTMKDAINALSIKGMIPTFVGHGNVIGQKPSAGTVVMASAPCTLFCEVK